MRSRNIGATGIRSWRRCTEAERIGTSFPAVESNCAYASSVSTVASPSMQVTRAAEAQP